MIWVRRILAIPLIVIFVVTFILALVLNHTSGTVGSAGFYNSQMDKAHVYSWVHEDLTPAALDEALEELPTDFPIDALELKEDIVAVAEETFPQEWLKDTFEGATKEVVPYVVGNKDSVTIVVAVKDRIDPMADGIKDVVGRHQDEIYEYVAEELIVPEMTEQLESGADLPYGITLTDEEIREFVRQAMPAEQEDVIGWVEDMIDSVAAYVKGDANSLSLIIDLTDVRSRATTAANNLVEQKLHAAFDSIQMNCTEAEFINELNSDPDAMPSCKPAGYSYEQFKQALETAMGMTMAEKVDETVIAEMPDSYTFDDEELRDAMGEDMEETLDDAREFIVDDEGRIAQEDLFDSEDTEEFDNVRHTIHTVRTWLWALWLIPILLLVAIGFLCGRNWKSRLLWALSVLLVTSLILIIVFAVARTFVPDRVVERPEEGEDATQVGIVIADKADEIAHNAINTFVWGLEVKLIICIVVSGLAIAGVIAWYIVEKRRRRQMEQETPAAPPAQT